MTTSGLRIRLLAQDVVKRDDLTAVEAARGADRAVHLDERLGACTLVQPVDVLRDHRAHPAAALELGEREVPVVRLRLRERVEALPVELPDLDGIGEERVDRRVLHRVVLRPEARWRAEVRDAGLRADACALPDFTKLLQIRIFQV